MDEKKGITFTCDEANEICKEMYSRGMDSGILASAVALIAAWGMCKGINVLRNRKK